MTLVSLSPESISEVPVFLGVMYSISSSGFISSSLTITSLTVTILVIPRLSSVLVSACYFRTIKLGVSQTLKEVQGTPVVSYALFLIGEPSLDLPARVWLSDPNSGYSSGIENSDSI